MIITKETDYALRILRVLLDGEKHSVAEMSETELIPTQFAYQILRKLSAGNLVRVSRGALGGCELSCDLDATSLYDLMGVMGDRGVLCACMEPGYVCRWQDEHGRCAIHCQLAALQRKQAHGAERLVLLLLQDRHLTVDGAPPVLVLPAAYISRLHAGA